MSSEEAVGAGASRIHFPRLDGLRSVAALAVVVAHIEAQKKVFGFGATAHSRLEFLGQTGVSLFFVLSGYLITFLLLVERSTTATVDVKTTTRQARGPSSPRCWSSASRTRVRLRWPHVPELGVWPCPPGSPRDASSCSLGILISPSMASSWSPA